MIYGKQYIQLINYWKEGKLTEAEYQKELKKLKRGRNHVLASNEKA